MTRYGIDADAALRIVTEQIVVDPAHSLVAPALLKSQVLDRLYRQVRAGEVERADAYRRLDRFTALKVRLLSDRVSRATTWEIASELEQEGTAAAEYLAVTRLQADALIALDPEVAALADGVVPLAPLEALRRGGGRPAQHRPVRG